MDNKRKFDMLCRIRKDLTDDSTHISTINSAIENVADDFADLLKFGTGNAVREKIKDLKEPIQDYDSNLKNAKSYCQYEINLVDKEMKAE